MGYLIASNDHLIKLEGLHDYSVSPSLFIQPSSNQPEAALVQPAEMLPDVEEIDDSGNNNDELLDDTEEDRIHLDDFNLFGKKLKALCNNDW